MLADGLKIGARIMPGRCDPGQCDFWSFAGARNHLQANRALAFRFEVVT